MSDVLALETSAVAISENWRRLGAFVATVLLFLPPVYAAVYYPDGTSNDYPGYSQFVRHMIETGGVTRPNFLYPLLVLIVRSILGTSHFGGIHLGLTLIFHGTLGLLLYLMIVQAIGTARTIGEYVLYLLLVGCILTLGPFIFLPLDGHRYFGYITPTVYHNANIALCRPLALIAFIMTVHAFNRRSIGVGEGLVLGIVLILSALAKPNFVLAFLPAVILMIVLSWRRLGTRFALRITLFVALPVAAVLLWQYWFMYNVRSPDVYFYPSVIWAPFQVWNILDWQPKAMLSLLYPMIVFIVFGRELWSSASFRLATLCLVVGLVINYGLSETGKSAYDLNFSWTGQMTLFLFLAVSSIELMRVYLQYRAWSLRWIVVFAAFTLQLAGGIYWYYLETTASGRFW